MVTRSRIFVPHRGDIISINFEPQSGHEIMKRRPSLVLSPNKYNKRTGLVILCPITSTVRGDSFEVRLPIGSQTNGVVLSDQVRCFDYRARSAEFVEKIDDDILYEVQAKIGLLIGLELPP